MKLDALDHPKTLDFAARLNCSRPTAIGYLELLWAFTGKQAPAGNIGKFPDGAIARACDFMGEPQSFLQCLLQSGFIDLHPVHRYVVHDWQEHCPRWVAAKLGKLGAQFVGNGPPISTVERTAVATVVATAEASSRARVPPGEGKGREGKPCQGSESTSPESVDNGDNSIGPERRPGIFDSRDSPPKEPSPGRARGPAALRKNADFEEINDAVSKVLANPAWGCHSSDTEHIAKLCGITEAQAIESVRQLRDRGRLPTAGAAA